MQTSYYYDKHLLLYTEQSCAIVVEVLFEACDTRSGPTLSGVNGFKTTRCGKLSRKTAIMLSS